MKERRTHVARLGRLNDSYPDTGESGEAYDQDLANILETIKTRCVKTVQFPANRLFLEETGAVK